MTRTKLVIDPHFDTIKFYAVDEDSFKKALADFGNFTHGEDEIPTVTMTYGPSVTTGWRIAFSVSDDLLQHYDTLLSKYANDMEFGEYGSVQYILLEYWPTRSEGERFTLKPVLTVGTMNSDEDAFEYLRIMVRMQRAYEKELIAQRGKTFGTLN